MKGYNKITVVEDRDWSIVHVTGARMREELKIVVGFEWQTYEFWSLFCGNGGITGIF